MEKVLLGDGDRHVWKLSFQPRIGEKWLPEASWEIDARTGGILYRGEAAAAIAWGRYVLNATWEEATRDMLTQQEAVALAIDGLRIALNDDAIPFDDPACYDALIHYNERRDSWSIRFKTLDLRYGSCQVTVQGADRSVLIDRTEPMQPDGDSLYRRWQDVYGYGGWEQETWIAFSRALSALEPAEWQGRLLKKTVYLPLTAARLTRDQAVDIAAKANGWPVGEATRATLLGMDGKPVWKIIVQNLITPFNLLNFLLAACLVAVESYRNMLFLGVVVSNTLIGIIQELSAKKTVERLKMALNTQK